MPMILVSLEDGSPIVLNKAVMFFGRSNECDIILSQSRKVSRKHCCVAQIDDSFVVRDLGSMNGVRVNQRKADPELQIEVGDELWIGDVGYRLQTSVGKNVGHSPKPSDTAADVQEFGGRPMASSEHPIAIPDEGQDLIIEESFPQKVIRPEDMDSLEER